MPYHGAAARQSNSAASEIAQATAPRAGYQAARRAGKLSGASLVLRHRNSSPSLRVAPALSNTWPDSDHFAGERLAGTRPVAGGPALRLRQKGK